jgi:hypothetical protein
MKKFEFMQLTSYPMFWAYHIFVTEFSPLANSRKNYCNSLKIQKERECNRHRKEQDRKDTSKREKGRDERVERRHSIFFPFS